jgi:ribose transport system permease protein
MNEQIVPLSSANKMSPAVEAINLYWRSLVSRRYFFVLVLLLGVSAYLSLNTQTFLTSNNLFNVVRSCSWIAIAAFGESMVIIIGGVDLSVGAVMAMAGLITAMGLQAGLPIPLAIGAGLLTGGLAGWVNGAMVGRVKLPPYIITLGTMSVFRGLAFGLTGGWPLRDFPSNFNLLGVYSLPVGSWEVPLPILFMLGLTVLVSLLLNQTVMGRYIYALGGSERALLVSGVKVAQINILVYTVGGVLAAIGGLLMTARLGVAAPTAALGYELDIIAAAIIGGTSLFGGEGSMFGVLLGAMLMQILRNGLVLLGVPGYWQVLLIGAMTLMAILLDYWRQQKALP